MTINKKELGKLTPEERIIKLKLLEEEKKKEVEEIGALIKRSMQELKTDKIAEEFAPEQKSVDIARLFEVVGEQNLEETARKETKSGTARGYQIISQTYEDYSQLKKFYGVVATGGSLTDEERNMVGKIGERINVAERYMTEGERTATLLNASKAIVYKLEQEQGLTRRLRF